MKNRSITTRVLRQVAMIAMLALPVLSFAQDDSPAGPNSPNPDQNNPLSVPFDSNMTCLFLLIAAFAAFIVVKKIKQKKVVNVTNR